MKLLPPRQRARTSCRFVMPASSTRSTSAEAPQQPLGRVRTHRMSCRRETTPGKPLGEVGCHAPPVEGCFPDPSASPLSPAPPPALSRRACTMPPCPRAGSRSPPADRAHALRQCRSKGAVRVGSASRARGRPYGSIVCLSWLWCWRRRGGGQGAYQQSLLAKRWGSIINAARTDGGRAPAPARYLTASISLIAPTSRVVCWRGRVTPHHGFGLGAPSFAGSVHCQRSCQGRGARRPQLRKRAEAASAQSCLV